MPKIFNQKNTKLEYNKNSIPEFRWLTSEDLSKSVNVNNFACNIRVLEQGKYSYPYHYHHNAEELFVILEGKGKLRTPEGIKNINKGDIIIFETGEYSAHQIFNDNESPLVYLDLRTIHKIDICEYPDSGKVNILPMKDIFYKGKKAEYFDDEHNVSEIWSELLK